MDLRRKIALWICPELGAPSRVRDVQPAASPTDMWLLTPEGWKEIYGPWPKMALRCRVPAPEGAHS